jgi:hypothetical protein
VGVCFKVRCDGVCLVTCLTLDLHLVKHGFTACSHIFFFVINHTTKRAIKNILLHFVIIVFIN